MTKIFHHPQSPLKTFPINLYSTLTPFTQTLIFHHQPQNLDQTYAHLALQPVLVFLESLVESAEPQLVSLLGSQAGLRAVLSDVQVAGAEPVRAPLSRALARPDCPLHWPYHVAATSVRKQLHRVSF